MRSREEVALVLALAAEGLNSCEIARRTGIPRRTIRDWRLGRRPSFEPGPRHDGRIGRACAVCGGQPMALPQVPYTYLLGLYLGDGSLATHLRGVYRLRVTCANAYPELIRH
jgi:hypothetical protein